MIVAVFIAALVIAVGLIAVLEARTCSQYAVYTGLTTEYSFPDSCYVKVDGKWVRYDEHALKQAAEYGLRR